MKLTIELVPKTSWAHNVRTLVSRKIWDTIRKKCYAMAGSVCEICGGVGKNRPVECHEIWQYNDDTLEQTLVGFIALCPKCHRVKHLGRTVQIGLGKEAIKFMAHINEWSLQEGIDYYLAAVEQWQERSKYPWQVNISYMDTYIE